MAMNLIAHNSIVTVAALELHTLGLHAMNGDPRSTSEEAFSINGCQASNRSTFQVSTRFNNALDSTDYRD
jgi:hypothetical protein